MSQPGWLPDPTDPRAPSRDVWDALTPAERARVVAALPAEVPMDLHPPEGDLHRAPKDKARDALDDFFKTIGRRVYVTSEIATYYPGEARFCPDVLAVLDVETHPRSKWVVADEGKGLDFVIEVHVAGDRAKDFERNVVRYARLGIPEYFAFDRGASRLVGYRLPEGATTYERIVPQAGRFHSNVLGLDLLVENGLLRFFHGTAPLLFAEELVARLNATVAEVLESRDAATARADDEARRADVLEARVRELEAELARRDEGPPR